MSDHPTKDQNCWCEANTVEEHCPVHGSNQSEVRPSKYVSTEAQRKEAYANFLTALDACDVPVSIATAFQAGWDACMRRSMPSPDETQPAASNSQLRLDEPLTEAQLAHIVKWYEDEVSEPEHAATHDCHVVRAFRELRRLKSSAVETSQPLVDELRRVYALVTYWHDQAVHWEGEEKKRQAELAKWQANCTGRHGSQMPCLSVEPFGKPPGASDEA